VTLPSLALPMRIPVLKPGLLDGTAYVARGAAAYASELAPLRTAIELDRFGLVAQVLKERDGCTVERCDALAQLRDSTRVLGNLRERAFEEQVKKYTAIWNAPRPATGVVAAAGPSVALPGTSGLGTVASLSRDTAAAEPALQSSAVAPPAARGSVTSPPQDPLPMRGTVTPTPQEAAAEPASQSAAVTPPAAPGSVTSPPQDPLPLQGSVTPTPQEAAVEPASQSAAVTPPAALGSVTPLPPRRPPQVPRPAAARRSPAAVAAARRGAARIIETPETLAKLVCCWGADPVPPSLARKRPPSIATQANH
jgi:hypothetical protein